MTDDKDVLVYLEDAYSFLMDPAIGVAIKEIKRLRQQNAELVDILKLALTSHGVVLTSDPPQDAWKANGVSEKARAAIGKATGGE